ncbi:hypothetical protein PTSG_01102 [Salpingoeca rosetta]|uniref:Cation efflux protein transmembrane domain-containing protein n=1 Tax=Salpingoeca rosetta (strain ATCC 50818 / BSB-021) TaxID=946362 RepID=F2U0T7_SALR5|nr:uncharacterized protein PTSG_01102 [Salpingoeca rosetta]EGD80511.1 hypothetical protein PTSG_01102 [Salpingoeca rosetta]|eukprot:XP_004997072.1 hypothetical protein PTSG_01102 [Salpingoeca rosetta]
MSDEDERRPLFSVNGSGSGSSMYGSDDDRHSRTHSTTSSDASLLGSTQIHQRHGHSHSPGHGHSHGHGHGHGHDLLDDDDEILFCPGGITGKETARQMSNMARILLMGVLMLLYSLGEIVFSLKVKSLTMFSDGLHNLSDAFALAIALWAERVQTKDSQEWMTFGWKRAETIGGFVNAGFVLSMAVFVVLQAVPDFIYPDPDKIQQSEAIYFVIIAAIGIFLNVVGMIAFCGHGHAHGHSHGGGGGHSHGHSHGGHGHSHDDDGDDDHAHENKTDHNIWALFLHFLGDVLTSILVLAVGLIAKFYDPSEHKWVQYMDPTAAVLSSLIIVATAWPVMASTMRIFLQFSPSYLDIQGIKAEIRRATAVVEIHEAHFWQLVDGLVICTMHLKIAGGANWEEIRKSVLSILHRYGIHNTTLQPEFIHRGALLQVSITEF